MLETAPGPAPGPTLATTLTAVLRAQTCVEGLLTCAAEARAEGVVLPKTAPNGAGALGLCVEPMQLGARGSASAGACGGTGRWAS